MKLRTIAALALIVLVAAAAVFLPGLVLHRERDQIFTQAQTFDAAEYSFGLDVDLGAEEAAEAPEENLPQRLAGIASGSIVRAYSRELVGDVSQELLDSFRNALGDLRDMGFISAELYETRMFDLDTGDYVVVNLCYAYYDALYEEKLGPSDFFYIYSFLVGIQAEMGTLDEFLFDVSTGKIIALQALAPPELDTELLYEEMGLYLGMEVSNVTVSWISWDELTEDYERCVEVEFTLRSEDLKSLPSNTGGSVVYKCIYPTGDSRWVFQPYNMSFVFD